MNDPAKAPARPRNRANRIGAAVLRALAPVQARASLVPDVPVLDAKLFPFLDPIRQNAAVIQAELQEILRHREDIPGFEEISPDQARIARNRQWKTFFLYGFGHRVAHNCDLAPRTAEMLGRVPKLKLAMFSILEPRYHIPAHFGVSKGFLRCHLGLVVPRDSSKCVIRIGTVTREWREGELLVFDDTFEHEVRNDTDEVRIVLLFDFDRPMRWPGRALNWLLVTAIKATPFYRVPLRNMQTFGTLGQRPGRTHRNDPAR